MSLLHQDTPEEIDDAALGEEFTKGSSHVVWAGVIAAVLVIAVVVTVLASSSKPPAGQRRDCRRSTPYPQHGETSGLDANGDADGQGESSTRCWSSPM